MPRPTVLLDLPPDVYDTLQQRAQQHRRRLENEVGLTLAAAMGIPAVPQDDLDAVPAALASLDNDTLPRLSHSQPTVEDGVLLHALIDKRRRRALRPAEEQWHADLDGRHDRVMVLHARAVVLLHQRGVDVSERVARA